MKGKKKIDLWKLFGIVFILAGMGCFLYFVFLMRILGPVTQFNYFWLIASFCLAGLGLSFIFAKGGLSRLPKWLLFLIEGIVAAGCAIFIIVEAIIIICGNQTAGKADYVIVLGAKVNGTYPSLSLKARLDTAVEYLMKYPDSKVIVSGGKGPDEGISEAECMYNYLVSKQIAPDRIILENQSTNTKENLEFSGEYLDMKKDSVVLITNDFHVFRSVRIAKKMGYAMVSGQAAPSFWYLIPTNYAREFLAVVKDFLFGNISLYDSKEAIDEMPVLMDNVRLAYGRFNTANGKAVIVELWMTQGEWFTEEYAGSSVGIYPENYQGNYVLKTIAEDGSVLSERNLNEDWKKVSGVSSDRILNFGGNFIINATDYNNDDCPDFTIGQAVSSSTNEYVMYTVKEDGILELLCESMLLNTNQNFSIIFNQTVKNGEKCIIETQWNNAFGKEDEHYFYWNKEKNLYERMVE